MAEGVIAVDQQQRVLFANTAAGKLFDFVPPGVEGRRLMEVVRDHRLQDAVTQVLATHNPQKLEIEKQDESLRTLAVRVAPLPGAVDVGAVIVMHDNTELRRLETIRQEFIANVSHELKTPLSSIMAYTETLQRGAVDDPEHREAFLARIAEQGERLHNLIQDMLSLARIETAQQPFEIVAVDLAEVVRRCLDDYAPQAAAKSIELELADDLPAACVKADQEGLRVICSNLIDNAVKYTPDGGRIDVLWVVKGERVRFEVADTGPGIPRSEVGRVFERFYRIDKARSRELGSTGLGLSIVKHQVQSFGGTVGVESQVGQGSRFWVELPLA
jgi:two-component system phosphate regulon sensor histidine kinase PhoR